MPIVKYNAVHTTPKAHLRYILDKKKNEDMKYVTAINTSADCSLAFEDFKELYETFARERFDITQKEDGKTHVRIHSYIQSFDENVTAGQAHEAGVRWAKEMFGEDRPVIISTHTNTGHVHNHIAVCPFDTSGKRWLADHSSLKRCRYISDKIAKEMGIAVISEPRRKTERTYAEWLADNTGGSWKTKMADDIDRIVASPEVCGIDGIIQKMKNKGYIFTDEEKLIAKPPGVKYGCRFERLGFGYSREMLETRMENKSLEMSGKKISRYYGLQIEFAVCFKQAQKDIYRMQTDSRHTANYSDLKRSAELLTFLCDNNIHSKEAFAGYVNDLADREKELSERLSRLNLQRTSSIDFADKIRRMDELKDEIAEVKAEKKEFAGQYSTFLEIMESGYEKILKREKVRQEIEWYKQGYEISENGEPYRDFIETIRRMSRWADMVQQKTAEIKRSRWQEQYYQKVLKNKLCKCIFTANYVNTKNVVETGQR